MTADVTLAKRRTAYLHGVADAALAQEDEAERERAARAETEAAEAKRRAELTAKRDKLVEARLEALTAAEAACHEMIAAMGKVLSLGGELAAVYVALGEVRPRTGLSGGSAKDSLSVKLSATLRPLADKGGRFGNVVLARSWRQVDQPWSEEGVARLGRTEQEKIDDQ